LVPTKPAVIPATNELNPSSRALSHLSAHLTNLRAKAEATIKTIIEINLLLKLFLKASLPFNRALRDLTICKIELIITPYLMFLNAWIKAL
jgi:hypothetical protein